MVEYSHEIVDMRDGEFFAVSLDRCLVIMPERGVIRNCRFYDCTFIYSDGAQSPGFPPDRLPTDVARLLEPQAHAMGAIHYKAPPGGI